MSSAVIGLSWLASGISLLDDDWGHVKLAANDFGFVFSTGWEGLVGQGGYYRPIVVFTFYLNYLVGGINPAGYHVLNVLIHTVCAGLVFVLGKQMGLVPRVAFGGAVLFFVLPIHTDSVYWIVGRTDTVCALFYLSSVIVFVWLLDDWQIWKWVLLLVCAALAFLSKEMALSLPGVLLVLAWSRRQWSLRHGVWGIGGVIGVLLLYFVVRWWVLGGVFTGTPGVHFSAVRWGIDLAKSFAKFGMTNFKWFGGVVLVVTGVLYWKSHFKKEPFLRSVPFVLGMVCVVSLVPVLGHLHNWYLYIPSAFFCLIVAGIWLHRSERVFSFLFAGLLLYYAGVLVREGVLWREASVLSESFVADVVPHAQKTNGRLFVLNVPSAWTSEKSLSGKPILAYALKNAVDMRSSTPIDADVVMVNHVWMLGKNTVCDVVRDEQIFQMGIQAGGHFSFHGGGEGLVPPFEMERHWGRLDVASPASLLAEIELQEDDRVVFFDGTRVHLVE